MNGLAILLKSLGFDPEQVMQMIKELRDKAQNLDAQLTRIENQNAEILRQLSERTEK